MTDTTERRLSAIMLADIAGFSSLMERDEAGTFERVRAMREQLIAPKVAEHGGRIIKTTGDGFLAEFPSATSALKCGIEIQRHNHSQEELRDERDRIHMRIGINVGDIIIDGDDIAGDGVIIAARLEPLAPLDGICVSGTVREHIRQELGIEYQDLGDQHVKNISRPIRAYRVNLTGKAGIKLKPLKRNTGGFPFRSAIMGTVIIAIAGAASYAWNAGRLPWRASVVAPYSDQDLRMSFAVLPVSAPDGDKVAAQFADALTEAFIERQTNSPWARIVSRGSVEDALKKYAAARELGRALNVHFLLRGNVTRAGEVYNVTASIIDAESDQVLGTKDFTWPAGKPVHGYSAKVNSAIGNLAAMGYRVELARTKQKKSEDLDVRDLAYLANEVWHNDKATYDVAMPLLQRALAQAPDDRLALRLMVNVNLCECRNSWAKNPEEQEKIGADAMERYLARHPNDRYMTMQKVGLYELHGRFEDALALVESLLEKSPEDPTLLGAKAFDLFKLGKPKESLALIEQAMREEPNGERRGFAATVHYTLGNFAQAAELARKAATDMNKAELSHPSSGSVRLVQAAAEANLGHADRAKAAVADFNSVVPTVRTVSAIRKWLGPHADLAGYEPFYTGLHKAGVPD